MAGSTRITKLVLEGFKSFAKRTEFLFGDTFNVILGPNGSGKSNILDAVCFVLGKSSAKTLRAERSSHLIYNGGKAKKPAKQAEVSIFFENKDKAFPLEESEIKVSRIVRAKGDSVYKINGKTRTRQEVTELLGAARIDADGHNIILQGDIVRLVEMSPLERRELVEEVAGVSVYEEKKQQALNELAKVEEKLHSAGITLRERGRQLDSLKQEREQALKHKELTDSVRSHKATLLTLHAKRARDKLAGLEERSGAHREQLDALNAAILKLREEVRQRKEERERIQDELSEKGSVEQVKLSKEVEQLKIRQSELRASIANANAQLEALKARRAQLAKSNEDLGQSEKQLSAQRDALKESHADLERQLGELDQRLTAFKQEHGLDETGEIEQRMAELDKNAEEATVGIEALNRQRIELIREQDRLGYHIQSIDTSIERMKEIEEQHKQELEQLRKDKDTLKRVVKELNDFLNSDSNRARDLAKLADERGTLVKEQGELEVRAAKAKEAMAGHIATKKVIENRKKLGTIYGTVAELGQTDKKYATALEVAAAQRIHSIVVEDDATAAKAIKYLKSQRLGTATFLPLNKIRPAKKNPDLQRLAKQDGVYGFAIDLITFDPRFADVFSYVFGNTLVVDSIDTARGIGIGKARMVTLDGDMCETSGAMHGGYRHKTAGVFRDRDLNERLHDVRSRLMVIEGDISAIEEARDTCGDRITELRQKKAALEGDIIKAERALHLQPEELEASAMTKEDLVKKLAEVDDRLRTLDDELSEKNQALAEVKVAKTQLRVKLDERRSPGVLAELRTLEASRKELDESKLRLEGELKAMDERAGASRDAEGIANALKQAEKDEARFKDERKTAQQEQKTLEATLAEREKLLEQFQKQFKELFARQKQLETEIQEREALIYGRDGEARKEEVALNLVSNDEMHVKAELARLEAEGAQYEGVTLLDEDDEGKLQQKLPKLEQELAAIGPVNLRALSVYELAEKEYQGLVEKKQSLEREKEDVLRLMEEVEGKKRELFMTTLNALSENFTRIFTQLTTKGAEAGFELEFPEDPFAGGLRIKVKLTSEKFMDIRSLSGGEKTMTALAVLFAIQEYEPASFYVMDEVDAALDKGNSEKLAALIRTYSGKAQYVMITHNDAVMSAADIVYGITMKPGEGASKAVSLRMEAPFEAPKEQPVAAAPDQPEQPAAG